mgnify:CR=1 FL=1
MRFKSRSHHYVVLCMKGIDVLFPSNRRILGIDEIISNNLWLGI